MTKSKLSALQAPTSMLNTTTLPVIGKRSDVDKVTRARAVAARYESGKVFHHPSLSGSDFETELLQFPKGHDDMIDAIGTGVFRFIPAASAEKPVIVKAKIDSYL